MSWDITYPDGPSRPRPYRCTHCGQVGWTRLHQPKCEGPRTGPVHPRARMDRIADDDAPLGADLVIR